VLRLLFAKFHDPFGFLIVGLVVLMAANFRCSSQNPAASFYAKQESLPPEKRIPEWDRVKALMSRPAPAVGDVAPDFTLPTLDGDSQITRSAHQEGKPLLMIFGSYT